MKGGDVVSDALTIGEPARRHGAQWRHGRWDRAPTVVSSVTSLSDPSQSVLATKTLGHLASENLASWLGDAVAGQTSLLGYSTGPSGNALTLFAEARELAGGSTAESKPKSPAERVATLINVIRLSVLAKRVDLVARLTQLIESHEEEGEEISAATERSLFDLIHFLLQWPQLRPPELVMTPGHQFRAQWRTGPSQHLAIDFLGDGRAAYVAFAPDANEPGQISRVAGVVPLSAVIDCVAALNVKRWIENG